MREEVHVERTAPRVAPARVRRASWGAIFAGVFVTIVLQIMFTLLGAAIGAATINPMSEQNPAQGLGIGSAIWLLATGLISVWIGACVAGRLSGGPRRADGMIHGVVSWSVATLTMLFLLATATGALLGGAGALLGNAIPSGGGQGQGAMASMQSQVREAFPQAGALLPPTGREGQQGGPGSLTALAQKDPELATAMGRLATQGGAEKAPQARDQVVNLLTTKHNMNQQEAASLVTQWDQQFRQAQAQASGQVRQAGEKAAEGVAQGALWGFLALLLGLLAAAWGGWAGTASLPRTGETVTPATATAT